MSKTWCNYVIMKGNERVNMKLLILFTKKEHFTMDTIILFVQFDGFRVKKRKHFKIILNLKPKLSTNLVLISTIFF